MFVCHKGLPRKESTSEQGEERYSSVRERAIQESPREWIKNMRYTHTMEYYSPFKKNEIMPFAARWMDLEIIISNEVRQVDKDKYYIILLICRILKMIEINLFYKTETDSKT